MGIEDIVIFLLFYVIPYAALAFIYFALIRRAYRWGAERFSAEACALILSSLATAGFIVFTSIGGLQMKWFPLAPLRAIAVGTVVFLVTWVPARCVEFRLRSQRLPRRYLVIATVILIALLAAGAIASRSAREKVRRVDCFSCLRAIGCALHIYAGDHHDRFPDNLQQLTPSYIGDARIFICASAARPGLDMKNLPLDRIQESSDYLYVRGLTDADPPWVAQMMDKPGNHGDAGGNVLFVGGYAKWVDLEQLRALSREPWTYVEERTGRPQPTPSEETIRDLKSRLHVIWPGRTPE